MTLNFFAGHTTSDAKRHYSVLTVRTWLSGKRHLPPDLIASLTYLIPELKPIDLGEFPEVLQAPNGEYYE